MTLTTDTDPLLADLQYFASILEAEKWSIAGETTKNGMGVDAPAFISNRFAGMLVSLGARILDAETASKSSVRRSILTLVTGELNACKTSLANLSDWLERLHKENDLSGPGLGDVFEDIQNSTAKLSAKITIIEQVIQSEISAAPSLQNEVALSAEQLVSNRNMHLLERDANGISHCWTGPERKTSFQIPISRKVACEIRIRFIAVIKPEFAKNLTVLVEDLPVKHKFKYYGSYYNLICKLPAMDIMRPTELCICLPATYSPKELGNSEDGRKLGIAISEVWCGKPENLVSRMLRTLRLKA